jgi:thiol-disulfide isomerase/thioredoxin
VRKPAWLTMGRVWDALAIAVILFVAWKWLIAPRSLKDADAFPAPHVTYALLDGGNYALASHRGRVVFLDFWASWCEPCKLSLPLVESYARKHPEVDVVPVDVGEPKAIAASFAAAHGLRDVALDPTSVSTRDFQVVGYPTVVVIDPQGRIRATWQGLNPAVGLNMANAEKNLAN